MPYGNGVFAPNGLQPSQYLNGSLWTGQTSQYPIANGYATSLFRGDPVTFANTGTITQGSAGSAIMGVFWGVQYYDSTGTYQFVSYYNASTPTFNNQNPIAFVVDDPTILFDIQVGNATGSSPFYSVASDVGKNANFSVVNSAGNTISGNSGFYLDENSVGTSATLNLKIIRLTPNPLNGFGSTYPYNNVLCLINNHILQRSTGSAGI